MNQMNHNELVEVAGKWLKKIGCSVVLKEMVSDAQEIPDAIGWGRGVSILIECKTSRSDFKKDSHKLWRRKSNKGMGDWRFYLSESGIIPIDEIGDWGSLIVNGKKVEILKGPKGNCEWNAKAPFEPDLQKERLLLVSALKRVK